MIDRAGQTVTVRRIIGTTTQTHQDATVKASIRNYQPQDLIGPIQQGDREAIINPSAEGWPWPVKAGDVVIIDGAVTNVKQVETRHWREEVAFYVATCRG